MQKGAPGSQSVVTMPEEDYHENNYGEEVCRFEELVTEMSMIRQSYDPESRILVHLPDHAVGRKGKPSLEDECDDTSPIEQRTHHGHFHDHIMEANVEYNEWKGVHKCEQEERISYPSMKDLNLFVGHSGSECNPVRFACCCTMYCQ